MNLNSLCLSGICITKKSCTRYDPSSILPCPSFLFSPFSSVILQIASSALNSTLVLVCSVGSGLFLLPVAPAPLCLHIPAALVYLRFPFRKGEFQELSSHIVSFENEHAGSKKTLPSYFPDWSLHAINKALENVKS